MALHNFWNVVVKLFFRAEDAKLAEGLNSLRALRSLRDNLFTYETVALHNF